MSQQLTMTPQLQQAIKLLQMSSQELEAQLKDALETNPLLEAEELVELAERGGNGDDSHSGNGAEEVSEVASGDGEAEVELIAGDVELEESWDRYEFSSPSQGATGSKRNYEGDSDRTQEIPDSADEGLIDHLLWQLHLSHLSAQDRAIGVALIEAINEDGYLTEPLESIQESLRPEYEVDLDEVKAVLHRIQHFDPVGVGARDLRDSLRIQLALVDPETPGYRHAEAIVDRHLDKLAKQDAAGLKRALGIRKDDDLKTAIDLVRSLEPRPGSVMSVRHTEYVRPDVIVEQRDGDWTVRLHGDALPRLTINNYYADLIGKASREDSDYLRGQLQEARWLLKSLETRNDTLVKVASAIVAHQREFLERGPEAMKPLVLREVADAIDMHESTVSRVTTRKYMLTPRGVFELKYFFSSHVGTSDGGEASATAIQARIAKLIEEENESKPLSDAKIASILNEEGIDVARRTVAKYREALNIPASSKRKRLL